MVYLKEEGIDLKVIFGDNLVIVLNIVCCVGLFGYEFYIDLLIKMIEVEVWEVV